MTTFLDILETIGSIIFVILAFGFCIMVHELGHFLAARRRGLHIDAFSIGFKKIWSKKVNGVEYRIGCLPFGGYVELPQVDATDDIPKAADGTELKRAKPIDRIITAFSGPFFNVLSGFALACLVWTIGMPQASPVMDGIKVLSVDDRGPEYRAGLRAGDRIVKVNGERFSGTWEDFFSKVVFSIGDVTLDVERGHEALKVTYRPEENPHAPNRLRYERIAYPFFKPQIPIEITPLSGGAAAKAGIQKGDLLLAVNGEPLSDLVEFQLLLNYSGGRELDFEVERNGAIHHLKVRAEEVKDIDRSKLRATIGIRFAEELKIGAVTPGSPADAAGIRAGDRISAVNGAAVNSTEEAIKAVSGQPEKEIALTLTRNAKEVSVKVTPQYFPPRDVGIDIAMTAHPTPWKQFNNMLNMTYRSIVGMGTNLANQLGLTTQTSTIKPRHMSGPLGMVTILYSSVKNVSLMTGIYFVVIISFALAIFNLLPLPVLDGGHIAFAFLEMVFRKPLSNKILKPITAVFVFLLISLMVYVTFFDIKRTYHSFVPMTDTPAEAENSEGAKDHAPDAKQP